MSISLKEKVELAKNVGAVAWAQKEETKLHEQAVIRSLTAMSYPITTIGEVKRKLGDGNRLHDWSRMVEPIDLGERVLTVLLVSTLGGLGSVILTERVWCCWIFGALCAAVMFDHYSLYTIHVTCSKLSDYTGELPYGSLLAVDEARQNGIGEFMVWYPEVIRPNSDPIITGCKNNVMVQVFAWNLGQLTD